MTQHFLKEKNEGSITVIGTTTKFRGISGYLKPLLISLTKYIPVDVIDFRDLYPKFLYKSNIQTITELDDSLKEKVRRSHVKITYYNPFSWIDAFFFIKTKSIIINWWNAFLFPIYLVIMLLSKVFGKKVITIVHNTRFHELHHLYWLAHQIVITLSDFIIVHGESNAQNFGIPYPRERIGVIPHGIANLPLQTDEKKKEWRKKLLISYNHFTLLFVGTIRHYKGLDIFLDALDIIYKKGETKNLSVIIAGHPWIEIAPIIEKLENLKNKINIIYRFEFIPEDELFGYYYASDLTVLPYKEFHAQSGIAAESISLGIPAIASDLPSIKDWFGAIDCYFEKNNGLDMAKKIIELKNSSDKYNSLHKTQLDLRKALSWDIVSKQLLEILKNWKLV